MRPSKRIIVLAVLLALATSIFSTAFAVENFTSSKKTTKPAKKTAKPAKKTAKPAKKTAKPAMKTAKPAMNTSGPVQKTAGPTAATGGFVVADEVTGAPPAPTDTPAVTAIPLVTPAPVTSVPRPFGCPTLPPSYNDYGMTDTCWPIMPGETAPPRLQHSGGSPDVVGYTITPESASFTVVGRRFKTFNASATWVPASGKNAQMLDVVVTPHPKDPTLSIVTINGFPRAEDPENDLCTLTISGKTGSTSTIGGIVVGIGDGFVRLPFYPWSSNPVRSWTATPW